MKRRRQIELVLMTVAVIVVVLIVVMVAASTPSHRWAIDLSGAFFGAFFAFIFIRLGDLVGHIYRREARHYRALSRLQFELNRGLVRINDNLSKLKTDILRSEMVAANAGLAVISVHEFAPLQVSDDLIADVLSLDLLNELFSLSVDFERCTTDLKAIRSTHQDIAARRLGGEIGEDNYRAEIERNLKHLSSFQGYLEDLEAETRKTLAGVRVLSEDVPIIQALLRRVLGRTFPSDFAERRRKELSKLTSEIEQSLERSGARIERAGQRRSSFNRLSGLT